MDVLETLIAADRIVIAGLEYYDQQTGRALAENARLCEKNAALRRALGEPEDDTDDDALATHRQRIVEGRDKLHRKLWSHVLARLAEAASAAPDTGGDAAKD